MTYANRFSRIKNAVAATTVKVANYTPEQVQTIKDAAVANGGVITKSIAEKLAEVMKKSSRSIIAKASREGIYSKAESAYVAKTQDGKVHKKNDTADAIGKVLNLTAEEADSLTKANKTALVKIFAALASSVPAANVDENSPLATDFVSDDNSVSFEPSQDEATD